MTTTRREVELVHTYDLGLWWLVGNRLLPKIAGGSETANENTGGTGEGEGGGDPDAGGTGEGGTGEDESDTEQDSGSGEGERKKPDIERKPGEDRGAYRARRRATEAEARAEQAEKELEELRDRDRSETDRLNSRATKAEKRVASLEPTVRRQAIEIAFLKASSGDAKRKPINWVDAEDALELARRELSDIKVGDDGDIDDDEVRSVVEDMAKRKPHLVRRQVQPTPSGAPVGGGGRQQQGEITADELAKTFPAMKSRFS